MGSAGDLGPHQCVLGMEDIRIDGLERISSQIVVAIAGGSKQTGLAHLIFLHGAYDLHLVVFGNLINFLKTPF